MKKLVIAITAMFVLAIAAVAYAQVENSYTVTGSTSSRKAGSKKHPVPVGIKFGYAVEGSNGQRPAPVEQYAIAFRGVRVNTKVAKACPKADAGPTECPSRSIVGSGYIENATGNAADPNDKSIPCNAALTVINKGGGRAVIYVQGSPTSDDPRTRCAIELAAPIQAKFTNAKTGSTLSFEVPQSLLHPLANLDNAVTRVTSTIKRLTKKIHGKRHGFYESIGGCRKGKRRITVTFTPETGSAKTARTNAKCSSSKKKRRRR